LRKLGKTFTKRYAFKRKLTTDPEINRLYKKREEAIGSIAAVKNAALFETEEPLRVQTGPDIHPSDAAKIKLIHQGESDWPRRVIYPEQITDLRERLRDVWVVNLNVEAGAHGKIYNVRLKHLDCPTIVTAWRGLNTQLEFRPVDSESVPKIDANERPFFYLQGHTEWKKGLEPWDVFSCGVCPNEMSTFSATFYDREVAHLYASSLKAEVGKMRHAYPEK